MDSSFIFLNSVSVFDYKFILDISIPTESSEFSKKLKKEQFINDSIHLYYKKSSIKDSLLFYSHISNQVFQQPFISSNGVLYSLCSKNNITLEKILNNIYYKVNIPVFPICLIENPVF